MLHLLIACIKKTIHKYIILKKSGSLRQYYRDEPPLTNAGISLNLHPANNSASFKFKQKAIDSTGDEGTKALKIMVLLK